MRNGARVGDLNTKKLYLILGISLVALGVVGGVFYLQKKESAPEKTYGSDVLAVVDGMEIKQSDVSTLSKNYTLLSLSFQETTDPTEDLKNKINILIENYIVDKEANALGVQVSNEEINKKIKERFEFNNNEVEGEAVNFAEKIVKLAIQKEKLEDRVVNWGEGKFISVRFDRNYIQNAKKLSAEDLNKEIEKEKQYAKIFADNLFGDLKNNKISFEQSIQKLEDDNMLGKKAWGELWDSYTFNGSISKEESKMKGIYSPTISTFWDNFYNLNNKGYNEPVIVKNKNSEEGSVDFDAMYSIIFIESLNKTEFKSFEDWIKQKNEQYKVKIFVS